MKKNILLMATVILASITAQARDVLICQTAQPLTIESRGPGGPIQFDNVTAFNIVQNGNGNYSVMQINGKETNSDSYKRSKKGTQIYTTSWATSATIDLRPDRKSESKTFENGSVIYAVYTGLISSSVDSSKGDVQVMCQFSIQ